MERWIVMAGAIALVGLFCPAVLGFVIGAGGIMLATCIVYAVISGL
jgi:hypothetical protein